MGIENIKSIQNNDAVRQTLLNEDIKKKVQEKDKTKEPKQPEANPAAFNTQNANKTLDKAEAKAEGNKVDMSETKETLKSAFEQVLLAFKGNKSNLDTSSKKLVTDETSQIKEKKKQETPKLKENPNENNTGAKIDVGAVKKDIDNVMENLDALKLAKAQQQNNSLEQKNKEAQTLVV